MIRRNGWPWKSRMIGGKVSQSRYARKGQDFSRPPDAIASPDAAPAPLIAPSSDAAPAPDTAPSPDAAPSRAPVPASAPAPAPAPAVPFSARAAAASVRYRDTKSANIRLTPCQTPI